MPPVELIGAASAGSEMTVGDWIGAALNVIQGVAIVAGAIWAYYKFFRGRTFARRAGLTVTPELLAAEEKRAIRARGSFRNVGASEIKLGVKALYVYAVLGEDWSDRPKWVRVATAPFFTKDESVEGQEEISDDILVRLPDAGRGGAEPLAYRVQCRVYGALTNGQAPRWMAEAIVPGGLRPLDSVYGFVAGKERVHDGLV